MAATAEHRPRLLVFSDDWGRHPSSCQHLVRHLLDRWDVTWVNTVGTRRPRLSVADLKRVAGRLRRGGSRGSGRPGPRVLSPIMYPGFRTSWQRRLNAALVARALRSASPASVVLTTLPITADLVDRLGVDRWVYYCVDDFSKWPGTDHAVMDAMERQLVARADAVVCVSEVLRERLGSMGREAGLLTHGVDLAHWQAPASDGQGFLFWGLIDERLDEAWVQALSRQRGGLTLVGPGERRLLGVRRSGPASYSELPNLAAEAAVLVMPYVDAPVTRAMQPLKLKEYLATYKPVVVRDLPSTQDWADCCDLASSADQFVSLCVERVGTGLPPAQRAARQRRLAGESWSEKAAQLEAVLRMRRSAQ